MPKVSVVDMSGKVTGELELSERVFGAEVNKAVLHQAVVAYLANQRQGNQSALTRAEVRGGGAKPWRQKGTGRARQGSIRAPQWTHGGVAFAPKPRSYRMALNKKQRSLAMRSALSSKVADGSIKVVDGAAFEEIKTKNAVAFLSAIGAGGKTLVVTPEVDANLVLSARNIPGITLVTPDAVNVYEVLNHKQLVVLEGALPHLEARLK